MCHLFLSGTKNIHSSACLWANLLPAFPAMVAEFRTASLPFLHLWSTISKCLQLPGCGRYGVRPRQRRYDRKKEKYWLVSLSACRLSYPSVNGKIFTLFVDCLSFEFALSNPRRTLFFLSHALREYSDLTISPKGNALFERGKVSFKCALSKGVFFLTFHAA